MSSFCGKMREYDLMSIDRFDGKNLESSVYFLSHNHADHTIGLDSSSFQYRLLSNSNFKLYCSNITRDLLLLNNKYKSLKDSIVALEVNEPHRIALIDPQSGKEKDNVTVTLLPAEHCPGSVMFLFEGSEGTVLYTGDYRLSRKDLSEMKHLHSGSRPKEISSLYIDTTFCVPQAVFIPERDESLQAVIDIIQEWISLSDCHIVNIKHKAVLGYENLFKKLSLHFNMKVHVHPEKYKMYEKVGNMTEYTTPNPRDTQIHACRSKYVLGCSSLGDCCLPAGCSNVSLRTITVSTMCFVQKVSLDTYAKRFSESFFRVCYSFHPSYCEVRDTILYLQPHQAFANVIPVGETLDMVQQRINHFVNLAKQSVRNSPSNQQTALGRLKVRKRKLTKLKLSQQSDESLELQFGDVGESPVKCKRHRVENDTKLCTAAPVLGDGRGDSENTGSSQKPGDITGIKNNDVLDSVVDSSGESNEEDHDDISEDFVLQLSLSQDDNKVMEGFTPKLQDSYGSLLGYISETGSDDGLGVEKLSADGISPGASLTLDKSKLGEDESSVLPVANGDIKLTGTSDTNGAKQLSKAKSAKKCSQKGSSPCRSSVEGDLVERGSSNSVRCSDTGNSLEGEMSDKEVTKSIEGTSKVVLKHAVGAGKNMSMHSSDVILLEDDEQNVTANRDIMSQETTNENDDQQPTETNSYDMEGCSLQDGKNIAHVIKENGKTLGQGPVTCTIDLTEMDEDDEVYPSTSTQEPRWYSYHGQNLFSQFSHPALRQTALGCVGADADDDVEFSEKEVACSDDECECGGKAKGGTHKYMVPRPKKPVNKFVPFQINWQIDSEGSDEDSLLELPAHIRTRKWIESQSLYMQRRHYLNSQVATSSEVIVIDSDDEDNEPKNSSQKSEGKVEMEKCKEHDEHPIDKTDTKQPLEKSDDSEKTGSNDRIPGNFSGDKNVNKVAVHEGNRRQQNDNNGGKDASNKEKDSLSVDLSLTSCPTNLSVLAQASDMSLKSTNINDISELRRTVNGDNGKHADSGTLSTHRQTRRDDKGSAS